MVARLLAVVALVAALVVGQASVADTPQDELAQVETEIKDLNRQIAAERQQGSEVAGQLAAAEERLGIMRADLGAATARLDAAIARVAAGELELERLNGVLDGVALDLAETRLAIIDQSDAVRGRAAEMYMNQSIGFSGLLMELDSVADAAVGWEYAGRAIEDGEAMVRDLDALRVQEELQQAVLEEQQAAQVALVSQLDEERATLATERAAAEAAYADADAEAHEYQALLASVKAEIELLDNEVDALERDAKQLESEIRALQSAGGTRPGALAWPFQGRISSPFGYRIHPITGARKLHSGIDIAAPYGTAIGASGAGTVIYAGWYGGYGYTVIIDHGGGLTTLYAHQARVRVSVGDVVSVGQRIGDVGSTGASTGNHTHLETRENGTPVDPMKYLSG